MGTDTMKKKLLRTVRSTDRHWVGDGFPVRTLFAYPEGGEILSPFLMLDYAGPVEFPPTSKRLGVGEHPHRGFETVTVVYAGEVQHRDSSGGGGTIGPGDVQWMTAAAGIVHEEFHSRQFAQQGGTLEMVQLWVNLPARDKMSPPRYQTILNEQIPVIPLANHCGTVRVIAGEYNGRAGLAQTVTPMHMWDLRLTNERPFDLVVPDGYTTLLVVLKGRVFLQGSDLPLSAAEVGLFERTGTVLSIKRAETATALLLCGAPIDEPIVGSGPFVMNTKEDIHQAVSDYQSGKMGHLS